MKNNMPPKKTLPTLNILPAKPKVEAPTIDVKLPDPVEWSQAWAALLARGQKLMLTWLNNPEQEADISLPKPYALWLQSWQLGQSLLQDPAKLLAYQISLWKSQTELWTQATQQVLTNKSAETINHQPKTDKRFQDPLWQESALFGTIKQSYLLSAQWLNALVSEVKDVDPATQRKLAFYTRQLVDALSPSNFLLTNPQALRETMQSGGENLLRGFENLLEDLEQSHGRLQITMTDPNAFKVGENLAATKGEVVFRNDLIELIQYAPSTKEVLKTPLLIIPPWINKFYILDMQPKNSFVHWAVDQGHTVFMVSWVNPDAKLAHKKFEDYLKEGPMAALREIERICKAGAVNVIGYCLGGTLLASYLAQQAAKPDKTLPKVSCATYLVTLVDFADPGELGLFVDDEHLAALEEKMRRTGVYAARDMALAFNMLRANDLIWSFVVNNYLLGREPLPFDLLYWNSDSTNMPAAMHSFYLRQMYQANNLIKRGAISLLDTPIDLHKITTPSYLLSCREDHIAPWASTYAATQIYQAPLRFVLASSGHIAGVINPPAAEKYGYWVCKDLPAKPEDWLEKAEAKQGSWWVDWQNWVQDFAGENVAARNPTHSLCAAPGEYVKMRA